MKTDLKAKRLSSLGASVFTELDELRKELERTGKKLINLSIGSPDRAPDEAIRKVLAEGVLDGKNYGYTLTRGTAFFPKNVQDGINRGLMLIWTRNKKFFL